MGSLFLVLTAWIMCASAPADLPIPVGDRKQLFIDHRFIAESQGIELRVNPPVKRLDGFISADAPYAQEGWLTTPLITFSGRRLELNLDCGALGEARVELRGQNNLPIQQFAAADCDLVRGNHLRYVVRWRGKDDLAGLAGRPVRLHFRLRNAKLYAFQFPSNTSTRLTRSDS